MGNLAHVEYVKCLVQCAALIGTLLIRASISQSSPSQLPDPL